MKNENTKVTKGIKRALVGITSVVMLMTNAAVFSASADTTGAAAETAVSSQIDLSVGEKYHEHAIIPGNYTRDGHTFDFKYSDGFFETDPLQYNTHMANTSMAMTHASVTVSNGTDYSHAADCITSVLDQEGFGDLSVSDTYLKKPETDTVASVIARKKINTAEGEKTVVSITVRSAGYEKEWASNVTLGSDKNAEAKGFADSADEVMKHVRAYLSEKNLEKDFEVGKVVFWLQGYSRGAAIANLTAKRIIDEYDCAPVYAYCLGCPQGGIKSAELAGKNYNSIHNVINVDDVTTYVAPSKWGFKRYGVDHYVQDDNFNSNELRTNKLFENNLADNDCWAKQSDAKEKLFLKHLDELTYDADIEVWKKNLGHATPVMITDYKAARNGVKPEIIIAPYSQHRETSERLGSFMNALANGISRDEYVKSGMEDALRRLMVFANGGGCMETALKNLQFNKMGDFIKNFCMRDILLNIHMVKDENKNEWEDLWDLVRNNTVRSYYVDFNENVRESIAKAVDLYMNGYDKNSKKQFESYPGGSDQAVSDIKLFIKQALKGCKDLDNVISIAKAGGRLTNNHSFIQSLAWVRAADSWFEPTAKDCD